MSLDTAQPSGAAETAAMPVSREDALAAAADAFKVSLGQKEAAPDGGDAAAVPEDKIDASIPPDPGVGEAESRANAQGDEDEAAGESDEDQAQPDDVALPRSWPAEHAQLWTSLPPEAQTVIAEREGQRDAAVNAKFQEAANLRRAHESEIGEARTIRSNALKATDLALALIRPHEPSLAMLDVNSDVYDPDGYHLAKARHDQALALIQDLSAQQQHLQAQARHDQENRDAAFFHGINQRTHEALFQDVPELGDQAKAAGIFSGLMEYAVERGLPMEVFEAPTNAFEWHVLWKAREYDRLQAAKARVRSESAPAPRRAQPAIRPGVSTPPSARRAAARASNLDRLARSGSIEAGAAVWKDILKG